MKLQTVLEALADPNRRQILELLKSGPMTVAEIGEHFDISGASLSHHLAKLKSAELVTSKRKGQFIQYTLHTSMFEDVASVLAGYFSVRGQDESP